MTGGDEHGTQVERVSQWLYVRMWGAGHGREWCMREVPVPRPLATAQDAPPLRHRITRRYQLRHQQRKEVMALTVTISAALLMGAAVFILVRYAGMRIWHAAVCIIFGFYLASSSLAPDITNIMTSLFRLL